MVLFKKSEPKTSGSKAAASKPSEKAAKKSGKPAAKATAKSAPPAPVKKKSTSPVTEAFNKTQLFQELADSAGVSRKQAAAVVEALGDTIARHVKKNAVGEFTLPGLLKIIVVRKPATKARKGINPFTKEEVIFKAKPAKNVIKVRPLKKLKDMAE